MEGLRRCIPQKTLVFPAALREAQRIGRRADSQADKSDPLVGLSRSGYPHTPTTNGGDVIGESLAREAPNED